MCEQARSFSLLSCDNLKVALRALVVSTNCGKFAKYILKAETRSPGGSILEAVNNNQNITLDKNRHGEHNIVHHSKSVGLVDPAPRVPRSVNNRRLAHSCKSESSNI